MIARRALLLTLALMAVAGCGDDRKSVSDYCKSHGGGPAQAAAIDRDGATFICGDGRLRYVAGSFKP